MTTGRFHGLPLQAIPLDNLDAIPDRPCSDEETVLHGIHNDARHHVPFAVRPELPYSATVFSTPSSDGLPRFISDEAHMAR